MEHTNTSGNERDRGVMDRVKQGAVAQLSTQKDRATDGLGSLANAVRKTSEPLRESNQDTIARYVEQTADSIDRLSSRLREREVRELVDDAQRLARRRPAVFIGGAFAVGVLAARFLKSSPPENGGRDWRSATPPYGGAGTAPVAGRTPAYPGRAGGV